MYYSSLAHWFISSLVCILVNYLTNKLFTNELMN